jgi:hypothetical protein
MRRFLIAVLALAITVAVASVAMAANTYDVHVADSKAGKGSMKRPIPTFLDFGFRVSDTEDQRPFVIKQYRIAAEGTRSYPDSRPKCTYAQATDPTATSAATLPRACRRAIVGQGRIDNVVGATTDRSQKVPCEVAVTLVNIRNGDPRFPDTVRQIRKRGGMAIRIDGAPPTCITDVHEALAAPFYDTKIQGVPTTELRFTVPDTLRHPGGTLDNAIAEVVTRINKKTGKVPVKRGVPQAAAKRKVGYYSLVGRKGRTRTVRVTFVDESNAKVRETRQIR